MKSPTFLSRFFFLLAGLGLVGLSATPLQAQQRPDAGQTLQQQNVQPQSPQEKTAGFLIPSNTAEKTIENTLADEKQVVIQSLEFSGNTRFTTAELRGLITDAIGLTYDLAGLRHLAERVSAHYRTQGYPFAHAYIPSQIMQSGKLLIAVVEGRYGQVKIQGEASEQAQCFLDGLASGDLIETTSLERAILILGDQPGYRIAPVVHPGQAPGTGDLLITMNREPLFSGSLSADNHGNRYTGAHRVRSRLQWGSPFVFGDQVLLQLQASDEKLWLGNLGYSRPLGGSGLQGQLGYSHVSYELGKDFAALDASGVAKIASLGLSYPLIRTQTRNVTLAATYQHKSLNDRQALVSVDDDKTSHTLPITLSFDQRDRWLGGGITYGALIYTPGRLKLSSVLNATDQLTGRNTRASFNKWNLELARIQATGLNGLTLFGRLSTQSAGKNLDSSESFSLGGSNGVRGYPTGEATGDEGHLIQLEARYSLGTFAPYVFADRGAVRYDANPVATTSANNQRSLASLGTGLRYWFDNWQLDMALAWRTLGGKPQSDSRDARPRFWATVMMVF